MILPKPRLLLITDRHQSARPLTEVCRPASGGRWPGRW
jgi:hypothetical protein